MAFAKDGGELAATRRRTEEALRAARADTAAAVAAARAKASADNTAEVANVKAAVDRELAAGPTAGQARVGEGGRAGQPGRPGRQTVGRHPGAGAAAGREAGGGSFVRNHQRLLGRRERGWSFGTGTQR